MSTINLAELGKQSKEKKKELARNDVVYFINNFCYTFDPRPDVFPHDIPFTLYPFQEDHARYLVQCIREGHDDFTEKSRDMGVSWVTLAVLLWFWLFESGFQGLVGSRKEDYVDNGEVDSLYGKFDYLIRHLPIYMLPEGFNDKKDRTYMTLSNPENGNTILGESANKNFSRSGRYTVVFFDEFGFWNFASNSWQAAGDATRCRLAVTTPPNEPSYAKALRFSGRIKVTTLHWDLHPRKDQAWYEYESTRRSEDERLHELDISWEYTSTGRPYPEADQCPIGQYPYDPELPLYVSWDLGLDGVAINWWQPVKNSDWITLVESYEFSDKIIDFALPFFSKPIESRFIYNDKELALIENVKYWKPASHFGDPSGNARHIESGTSAYNTLRQAGIIVQTNDKANNFTTRRDESKKILMHLRINDTEGTKWWLQCVKNSRYPKRNEDSQSTTGIVKPVHDWTSHHRTSMEYFAVNYNYIPQSKPKPVLGWSGQGYGRKPIYKREESLLRR
jgi:hypothetical protein